MARKPSGPAGNEPIILTFAGGVNALRREADVDINECTQGQNFDLKSQQLSLAPRKSLEVVGIVPGGKSIRGYGQLVKADGTISTLIQSGGDVYSWDGTTTGFTLVGTVDTGAKLRSSRDSNVTDEDIVIITDLAKIETVKQWSGTTFQDFTHNLSDSLYAKYCKVFNERAYFANVKSGTDTPHVLLASTGGDVHTLTIANRPSSATNAEDPWFLPIPDLRPINGLEFAFGTTIVATVGGRIYQLVEEALQAATATISEKRLDEFYAGSSLAGDEAMVQIGNDVMLGLKGRIELLSGVQQYGDVQADDASLMITPLIEEVTSWTLAYDRQQQVIYCLPNDSNNIWVYYKNVAFSNLQEIRGLSPWSEFTTDAQIDMTNSTVMPIVNPVTAEETVFLGDQFGRIYAFAGERGSDDRQTYPVVLDCSALPLIKIKKETAMAGAATGQKGILSMWLQAVNGVGSSGIAFIATTYPPGAPAAPWDGITFNIGTNALTITDASAANVVLLWPTVREDFSDDKFHHFIMAWDLSIPEAKMYRDGSKITVFDFETAVSANIQYDLLDNWRFVYSATANEQICVAEFYLNTDEYLDLDVAGNLAKFYEPGGVAASLGLDGSTPTGNAPVIFLNKQANKFHVNSGDGGNFDLPSPALLGCTTYLPGGTITPITVTRTSKLFVPVPIDDEMFDIRGWITYKKSGAFTTTLEFHFGGVEVAHQIVPLIMPATDDGGFYHGAYYYGDGTPYSSKRKGHHHRRQNFGPIAGRGQNFHLEVTVEATTDFEIDEIGLLFDSSTR